MKSMKYGFSVLSALLISIPAFASNHYRCQAQVNGSVDPQAFTEMDLSVEAGQITGRILTQSGWLQIGPSNAAAQVTATLDQNSRVSLTYDLYHDQETLEFNLVNGEITGSYSEFIDCVGENQADVQVRCSN